MKNTTVRLDNQQLDKLELVALAEESSVSEVIRTAVAKYLSEYKTEELISSVRAKFAEREMELQRRIDRLSSNTTELRH